MLIDSVIKYWSVIDTAVHGRPIETYETSQEVWDFVGEIFFCRFAYQDGLLKFGYNSVDEYKMLKDGAKNMGIDRHARDFYRKYDEGNLHELCESFYGSHEMLCIVRSIFRKEAIFDHENGLWVLSDINPPKENSREYLCRALLKCGFNPIE